jgi:thiosulfate/3-mercaptopyruvate sulfurtransferase
MARIRHSVTSEAMAIPPLVTAEWLLDRLGQQGLVLVDCRWALGAPGAGERAWEEGHIAGAHFLDVEQDLSGPPAADGRGGRHPLPTAEAFGAAAASAGIGSDSLVVAYDEAGEGGAARLWWLLRHFGHEDAAVLDGALHGWRAAGLPLDDLPPRPWPSGDAFVPHERSDDVLDADDLTKRLAKGSVALLDARAARRYRGEVEPIDPVPGHIPGARNVPFAALAPYGRFLPAAELRARLSDPAQDGRELVAYCGSGVTAATLALAAEVAGLGDAVRLYPGSWSDWCARGLPVASDR